MVYSSILRTDIIVLYSRKDKRWKIADFGISVECTGVQPYTTVDARGTSGYRAPELATEIGKQVYTHKVDIWAVGCILYELALGKKAFIDDLAVNYYAITQSRPEIPHAIDRGGKTVAL